MSYSQTNTSINVSHFAGLVIGPKGVGIKALKEKYKLKNCYINDNSLILSGPGCAAAKKEVFALIKEKQLENRQRMDRNLMLAEANIQHKKQMKIDKKIQAEARLEALIQSQIETFVQPTYTYNGKFNFDSDSEDESDEINEPIEQSTNQKPTSSPDMIATRNLIMEKEVELSSYNSGCWADAAEIEELEAEIAVLKAKLIR